MGSGAALCCFAATAEPFPALECASPSFKLGQRVSREVARDCAAGQERKGGEEEAQGGGTHVASGRRGRGDEDETEEEEELATEQWNAERGADSRFYAAAPVGSAAAAEVERKLAHPLLRRFLTAPFRTCRFATPLQAAGEAGATWLAR